MTKIQAPKFPFFVFLIPVFYVWHKYNEYQLLPTFKYGIQTGLTYLSIATSLLFLFMLLYKRWSSAGLVSALITLFLLHWGSIHSTLKNTFTHPFLISYKFVIPIFLLLFLLLIIFLFRKKKDLNSLSRFLNTTILLLLIIETIQSINILSRNQFQPVSETDLEGMPLIISKKIDSAPDIYWIIFDEYASTRSLKENFDFDNSSTDSLLKERSFYIVASSRSNYNFTPHSISATLRLNYLDLGQMSHPLQIVDFLKFRKSVNDSPFPKILADAGYTIKNFGLFDLEARSAPFGQLFEDMDRGIFQNETLYTKARKEIGWNFRFLSSFNDDRLSIQNAKFKPLRINQNNFQSLLSELNSESQKPRFVYAHFLLPHENYLVDSDGNLRFPKPHENRSVTRDSLYLDQVTYSNTWIDQISLLANKAGSRPKVVIIQGDHGRRTVTSDNERPVVADKKSYENLNSYYFSDQSYQLLYDSITSVNTFRVILKKYFAPNFSLLPDSTVNIYEAFNR